MLSGGGTMARPLISVIICTHNRADYLSMAISSALEQTFDGFEVLVVDNASTDGTRALVGQFDYDSRFRYFYEPRLGLSVARNRGATEAQGAILVYLDDDARAEAGWLQAIDQAFAQDERVAIAGGKSTLIWPAGVEPPPWLSPALAGCLGLYDLGPTPRAIESAGETPRGLNYALRKSFWQQVGGFDTHLGRVGKNLLSNEELHMTQLALAQGYRVMYLPAATVGHHVAPERLCRRWFLQRSWWQGISECYRERLGGSLGWGTLRSRAMNLLRGVVKAQRRWSDPAERFDNLVYAYGQLGYLFSSVGGLPLVITRGLRASSPPPGGKAKAKSRCTD